MKKIPASFAAIFFTILIIYLITATLFASVLLPNCDEAWFLLPGYNLAEHGFFGTTVLDETATFRQVRLDGINVYTYWIMPLYPLAQAVWGKIFGFGLMQTRFLSFFCGAAALASWSYLIKKLSGNSAIALTAVGLMAVDYHFVYAASIGRMDMFTVSLGAGALAAFVFLREKNFDAAVAFSFWLTAPAFFAHPLGLLWFVSLSILIWLLDFQRIKLRHFIFAAMPYLLLAALWLGYISRQPDLFRLQFGGNASDRWGFFSAPFGGFWREVRDRYFYNFGVGVGLSRAGQIRILVLAAYACSVAGVLSIKSLREQTLSKFLLLVAFQQFAMILLLDSMRQHYYLIYITPTLIALLAVWTDWLRQKSKILKVLSFGILAVVVLINASVVISRVEQNAYRADYLSAANYLNQAAAPNDQIMASAEFWFALEKRENLTDDYRLGFRSGKKAEFVVMDKMRYRDWANELKKNDWENYLFISNLLENEFLVVFENKNYQIYKRR